MIRYKEWWIKEDEGIEGLLYHPYYLEILCKYSTTCLGLIDT